ncbi:hypothetical protein PF327_00245 [Sulfurovum sp. XTW-4]|uniref:Uncharacterized protein n=1 Tax=Sulfurovum xiamenensis TaxID=3019066 RepID=A0ABT7QNI9_9BACT|nr:hypothetical protein [Sulfurovum xiamenensis]MDM5262632.1 hypothetical protein [Sulfurovum xiamenensis]
MNSNNKTPILIIAPFFAPQSHAAMFRVHKLVKYLPQYGYKPIVVTTDINYNYNEDLSLLDEFSEDVEIHRVRYVEPTIRGLRMALGGKDRTFKAMKKHMKPNTSKERSSNRIKKKNFLQRVKSKIQNFILNIPDAYWTWVNPVTKISNELIKQYNIKLVYTTTNPDSVLKIGLNLKSKNDIKWVSDFRDPVGYGERYNTHHKFIDRQIKKLHLSAMNTADKITGLSSSYEQIFKDLYHIESNKFQFIPTGIDDEYIDNISLMDNVEKYLIFVGEFQEKYDDYIFKVLDNVLAKENIQFKIKIIGRKEINFKNISKYMDQYKYVNHVIEYIDHIPQLELYKEIKNAHSCILLTGGENFWWCNFAKMVDYIALQKYVIADVHNPSEAKKELEKTEKGIFLTKNLENDIKIVTNHMKKTIDDFQFENEYYKRYLASFQVKSFVEVFDNLLGMKNDK